MGGISRNIRLTMVTTVYGYYGKLPEMPTKKPMMPLAAPLLEGFHSVALPIVYTNILPPHSPIKHMYSDRPGRVENQ